MLMIDRFLQPQQFAFECTDLRVMALKQSRLKPGMEIFHGSIVLGTSGRDQKYFDPETQAQAQYP
jgi:hypothetical protein